MNPGIPVPFWDGWPPVADAILLETARLERTELSTEDSTATELAATVLETGGVDVDASSGTYVNIGGA